jgi:hypothetical protein
MNSDLRDLEAERRGASLLEKEEALTLPKIPGNKFNDVIFAAAFVGNLLCVLILALSSGISSIKSTGSKIVAIRDNKRFVDSGGLNSPGKMLGGAFLIVFLGGAMSIAWWV